MESCVGTFKHSIGDATPQGFRSSKSGKGGTGSVGGGVFYLSRNSSPLGKIKIARGGSVSR